MKNLPFLSMSQASLFTATISLSPKDFAELKYSMWPE